LAPLRQSHQRRAAIQLMPLDRWLDTMLGTRIGRPSRDGSALAKTLIYPVTASMCITMLSRFICA
jgi:hypothetical protein